MSTTAVEKGLQFEKAVVDMLNKCGFKAWRTNQSVEMYVSIFSVIIKRICSSTRLLVFFFGKTTSL